MECIFCSIVAGDIPSEFLYEDDDVVVFRDIHPVAPVHILLLPKKHITSLAELSEEEASLIGHLVNIARKLAINKGIADSGYRLSINSGLAAGQEVPHLHMHLIGGRILGGIG